MPTSQRERLWIGGTALAAVLLVLVGYFAFIGPQRSKTASIQSQVSDARTQNAVLTARINSLAAQYKNLATYQQQLAQDKLALPSTSGLPDFLRTLQSIGAATNTASSLTVGAPTDVTAVSGAQPAGAATSTAPGSTGGTTSGTTPGNTANGSSTLTVGSAHIYALPITATITGSPESLDAFLTKLQTDQPRAVLISQIAETTGAPGSVADSTTGSTSLQLTMQAFVAPSSSAEDAQLSQAAQQGS